MNIGIVLLGAAFMVVANILVDAACALLDPRVRAGQKHAEDKLCVENVMLVGLSAKDKSVPSAFCGELCPKQANDVTLTVSSGVLASPIASFSAACSAPCDTDDRAGFMLETPPPNTVPVDPTAGWSTPADLCCVIPVFTPELQVSVTTHRAAAIGILFAQQYLPAPDLPGRHLGARPVRPRRQL